MTISTQPASTKRQCAPSQAEPWRAGFIFNGRAWVAPKLNSENPRATERDKRAMYRPADSSPIRFGAEYAANARPLNRATPADSLGRRLFVRSVVARPVWLSMTALKKISKFLSLRSLTHLS